jgi:hypothetical protein
MISDTHPTPDEEIGFRVEVRVRRGASHREEAAFARWLDEDLDEHDLQHSGGPLLMWITRPDGEISATDQVDLMCRLTSHWMCVGLRLGDIGPLAGEHGYVDVDPHTLTYICLVLLYRSHRMSAQEMLSALGGFVTPFAPEDLQ